MFLTGLLQRIVVLASLQEDLRQLLHQMEARKMTLTEQKVAEQNRLVSQLNSKLQTACCQVDEELQNVHVILRQVEQQASLTLP